MKKKKLLTILYILLTVCIILIIGVFDKSIYDLGEVFGRLNLFWVGLGFLSMVLYWICDGIILDYTTASMYGRKHFLQSLKVALIGQYYNAVTPFASGGQPVQVYYMRKMGIPIGYAGSILTVKFLAYQTVLSLYCIWAMVLKLKFVLNQYTEIFWLSLIGFLINAAAVFLIILVIISKNLVISLSVKIISLAHRFKLLKDPDKAQESAKKHLEDFHKSAEFMKHNIWEMIVICVWTALQLTFYFSITYFIYRAFDLNTASMIDMIAIQSFLYLAVSFFPTPGASGASEGGFYIFFSMFFPKSLLFVSMLIWRVVSYYSNIIVGGILILADSIRNLYKTRNIEG